MHDRDNSPRPKFDGRTKQTTRPEVRTGTLEATAVVEAGAQKLGGQPVPIGPNGGTRPDTARGPANKSLQNAPVASVDPGRGLKQAGDRALQVDATMARYSSLAFNGKASGNTMSPYVAFTREFEGALLNEVAEKRGLLAEREGRGATQSRSFLHLQKAIANTFKGGEDSQVLFGASLAGFNDHFKRALEEKKRELISSISNEFKQDQVAAQLKVQQGAIRFVDPQTSVVVPAYALRVPEEDGTWKVYGFQMEGRVRNRELRLVEDGAIAANWTFEATSVVAPSEVGLGEMEGSQGVLDANAVMTLRERGIELVTHPVRPQDLLAGTVLESQDGSRVVLANLFSESLQNVADDPVIEQILRAPAVAGSAELMQRADKTTAAILVTLARLDRSTRDDVNRAIEGSYVDPVASAVEALRSTLTPLSSENKTEQMRELEATVTARIQGMGEGLPARLPRGEAAHRVKIQRSLVKEVEKRAELANRGIQTGDVFGAVTKVMSLAFERADERSSRAGAKANYGSDLALIENRSLALTGALKDVQAVLDEIGLDQKALAAFGSAPIHDQKLDVTLGVTTDGILGRSFMKTQRMMMILTHGGEGDTTAIDPFEQEHPVYPLANKQMAEVMGIVSRHMPLAAAEGFFADAFLLEASRSYLDAMGAAVTPENLTMLQFLARQALADDEANVPLRDFGNNPDQGLWYRTVRDQVARVGKMPASEEALQESIAKLKDPSAKIMMQRGAALMGLVGAHYGAMKAENRVPGYPIRLGKVNASLRLAQTQPSSVPDVPHYMANPKGVVRLAQVKDDAGKPSGKYIKVSGTVAPTGQMDWQFDGLLAKPKSDIPTEVYRNGVAMNRVEIMHASTSLPVPIGELSGRRVLDEQEMKAIALELCDHFSDVPLSHGGFLSHGHLDGGDALGRLGITLPSGAVRPMNLANAYTVLTGDDRGTHAELDLIPMDPQTGDFQRKRSGELEHPKRQSFVDRVALNAELERRLTAGSKGMQDDSDDKLYLKAVVRAVADHCDLIFKAKGDYRTPILAFQPTAGGEQRPSSLMVVPIMRSRDTRSRGPVQKDPEACTKAYAKFTLTLAKCGASFEGHETKV